MYNEPTRLLPKEVARLILCDSPPDKVFDFLFSVKYPSPTIFKNFSLSWISNISLDEIFLSCSDKLIDDIIFSSLLIGMSTKSLIIKPSIFTYDAS